MAPARPTGVFSGVVPVSAAGAGATVKTFPAPHAGQAELCWALVLSLWCCGHLGPECLEQCLMFQLAAGDVFDGNLDVVGGAVHFRVQGLRVPLQGCPAMLSQRRNGATAQRRNSATAGGGAEAVATTNNAIDSLNADLTTACSVANRAGTGPCASDGSGSPPAGLSHISCPRRVKNLLQYFPIKGCFSLMLRILG